MTSIAGSTLLLAITLVVGAACGGGGDGGGGPGPSGPVLVKASPSGDGQSGPTGAQLANPLRVGVSNGGAPVSGHAVSWAVTSGGGSVSPTNTTTNASGIAETTVTLPSAAGTITITATAAGVSGSPQTFTATAQGASLLATVQVVNSDFNPSSVLLRQGGTVTFTWGTGSVGHNVTPVAPAVIPASPGLPGTRDAPFTFDVVFPAQGTFNFFCSVHGSPGAGMRGAITVVP